jgi:phosphatidylserine/phosphatidylglycerophosphate/cardiolipin synthase-like enzyme
LKHSQTAKKRISLAALYLGTGQLEEELVRSICTNYCQIENLKVHVVMDRNRGTRLEHSKKDTSDTSPTTKQSAATLFQPSLQSAITSTTDISNFRVGLLEMPLKSNDWFTKFILPRLPPRYNELLTTFHLKAYVFDDTLIMSGANLSNDYFTSRQDRYWVIKNKALATLYHNMIEILYDASNDMNDILLKNKNNERRNHQHHVPITIDDMSKKLEKLMLSKNNNLEWSTFEKEAFLHTSYKSPPSKGWACIRPSIQCAAIGLRDDEIMTKGILERLNDISEDCAEYGYNQVSNQLPSETYVSTGYLNFHEDYKLLLLNMHANMNVSVLTASPSANGFFTASGISSSLPMAYSLIEQRLYNQAKKISKHMMGRNFFKIYEYSRKNWTYHAKGLWFEEKKEKVAENDVNSFSDKDRKNWSVPDDDHPSWGTTNKATIRGIESKLEQIERAANETEIKEMINGAETYVSVIDHNMNDANSSGTSGSLSGGSLTLIGSPNFGCRSVERDFESSLLIVTEDYKLRKDMKNELNELMKYTSSINSETFQNKDRKLSGLFNWSHGWWISPASRLVRGFM